MSHFAYSDIPYKPSTLVKMVPAIAGGIGKITGNEAAIGTAKVLFGGPDSQTTIA